MIFIIYCLLVLQVSVFCEQTVKTFVRMSGHAGWAGSSIFYHVYKHAISSLWTKFCETRQNFKGDLTKFCETFLNITLELPQYSLKSFSFFFFQVRGMWKPQQCAIFIYFFIKSVVKWSEMSVRFEFFMGIAYQMGQILYMLWVPN